MRFLADAQLPPALVTLIADHGYLAEHVTDIGPGDAPDRALWACAIENDAVLITKDEDFATMALFETVSPTIIWIRTGNLRRRELLDWFEPLIDRVTKLITEGNRLIELR